MPDICGASCTLCAARKKRTEDSNRIDSSASELAALRRLSPNSQLKTRKAVAPYAAERRPADCSDAAPRCRPLRDAANSSPALPLSLRVPRLALRRASLAVHPLPPRIAFAMSYQAGGRSDRARASATANTAVARPRSHSRQRRQDSPRRRLQHPDASVSVQSRSQEEKRELLHLHALPSHLAFNAFIREFKT
jgi:hypothetical protein